MAVTKKLRYAVGRFLDRLGQKETALHLLERLGIRHEQLGLSVETLITDFMRESSQQEAALPLLSPGKRLLIFAGRAVQQGFPANEGLLAWAMRLRGAEPIFVICDGPLTLCELSTLNNFDSLEAFANASRPFPCQSCYEPAQSILTAYGWNPYRLSEYIEPADWEIGQALGANMTLRDAFKLVYKNIPLGEHIEATAYRNLFRATLNEDDPHVITIVRRLVTNAVVMVNAMERIFDALAPDYFLAHHGIYLTGGISSAMAASRSIPVINWSIPYRRNTVLFSHGDTYHRTMVNEPVEAWENFELEKSHIELLYNYLNSHWKSGWDLWEYNRNSNDDPGALVCELGLDMSRPIVGLYTNLAWDARVHFSGNIFSSHTEWLLKTIEAFIDRPQVQLVIRIHPAEVKSDLGPVSERSDDLIRQHYADLPDHIHIIPPESALSSYGLMQITALNVVYATKLGIEMAGLGLRVVVVGEAYYRNKGFTFDPQSIQNYITMIAEPDLVPAMTLKQRQRARQYAYHFYFRRNISFPSLIYRPKVYTVQSLTDLLPGKYPNLDSICDGILNGTPFIAKTPF